MSNEPATTDAADAHTHEVKPVGEATHTAGHGGEHPVHEPQAAPHAAGAEGQTEAATPSAPEPTAPEPEDPALHDAHGHEERDHGGADDEHETHEPTSTSAVTEALVPVPEPVSEELVPVHDGGPETALPTAPAPLAESGAEPAKTDEPTPPKSAKKPRAPRSPRSAAAAPAAAPAAADAAAPGEAVEPPGADETPSESPAEPAGENKKKWYAIKVQSGREDSIKAAILRKVRIEGLEEFFGRIEIPVEEVSEKKSVKVKDKKTGETTFQEKKVTRKKKKFQGYLFAELEFNDRILYLFRETSGVGDFLNLRTKPGQPPTPEPMPEHEVQSMLTGVAVRDPRAKVKIKLDFEKGDKVRIRDGSFANSEGEVKAILEAKDPNEAPKVSVELTFWGRPLVVEFDSAQVEKV